MELNKRKKILIFIDWYEPGYRAGGPIRSVKNLVEHFKQEIDFFIITRNTDYQSTDSYTTVPSDSWHNVEPGVQVYYCSETRLSKDLLAGIIREQEWDGVYINGLYSWFFSLLPLWLLQNKHIQIIIAPRGMLAEGALGVKSIKKKLFLFLARTSGLYRNVFFHATHAGEAAEIQQHLQAKHNIIVAPNLAAPTDEINWQQRIKRKGELKLISIARISPEKNTKYALEVLRQISTDIQVIFHLYGPINDQQYWQECQKIINNLPPNICIKYKGSLPNEQVSVALTESHLMFLPSRGENFGHIILEAFVASTPVLISDRTPWKNLDDRKVGWDISLEEPKEFCQVIDVVAQMEQKEYDLWSKAACTYAQETVGNKDTLQAYRNLFKL